MAHRYRYRKAGDNAWIPPAGEDGWSLRRLMHMVADRQKRLGKGKPSRHRRREKRWSHWFTNATFFRRRFRIKLRLGDRGVFQFQVGGHGGPVFGVLKYKLPPPVLTIGQKVIEAAKGEFGTPYRFGVSNGPEDPGTDAFDCSGFTQWAWGTEGVFLPHSAEGQRVAANVDNFENAGQCQPGDLVFFNFPNSRGISWPHASHVGLWLRPGFVIDTRSQVSPVAVRPIEATRVVGYGRPHFGQQR